MKTKFNFKPAIAISIIGGAIFIAMMISTIVECNTPMETPSLKWRFEATDSGMYFNEYVKGELTRKFGPVPEYRHCNYRYYISNSGDTLGIWIRGNCTGKEYEPNK